MRGTGRWRRLIVLLVVAAGAQGCASSSRLVDRSGAAQHVYRTLRAGGIRCRDPRAESGASLRRQFGADDRVVCSVAPEVRVGILGFGRRPARTAAGPLIAVWCRIRETGNGPDVFVLTEHALVEVPGPRIANRAWTTAQARDLADDIGMLLGGTVIEGYCP